MLPRLDCRRILALGACLSLSLLAGCGGHAGATDRHTPTPRHQPTATPRPRVQASLSAPTDTPVVPPTATPLPTAAASPTATPRPQPTKHPAPGQPHLVSASASPSTVSPGASLHLAVDVRGAASSIEVYLSAGPGSGSPLTVTLAEVSPTLWSARVSAPSTPGTYHYSVGLYDFNGHRTIADNDQWNIQVGGAGSGPATPPTPTSPPASTGLQPLPANLPLAPPFSYGNPVAASFSAEGKQISGSEVVSDAHPEVQASTVAQFYSVHLPRAGWTLVTSTVPPPGATAFTMVATTGSGQICVVQFSGGVVHLFYGVTAVG